ncbi:MAG: T9SS type A sorting domain-containing protein [Balneola sp.]
MYRFSIGDTVHIGFNTQNSSTFEYEFRVYKFVDTDSIALADLKIINGQSRNSLVSDFDGDGNIDLLVNTFNDETYFYKGLSDSSDIFSQEMFVSNSFINISTAYLLGDIMDDERSEILYISNTGLNIVNYDSTSSSFSAISSISSASVLFSSDFSTFSNSNYKENSSVFADFNTFSVPIASDDKFGNVIFKTNNGTNSIDSELVLFNSSDFSITSRDELFHLSDLEGDGTDNFAVLERNNGDERIVIFNGIDDSTPNVINISNPDELFPTHVQAGFFNDSLNPSIAVLMRPRNRFEDQSEFRLYALNDLTTPYFAIKHTDLSPTLDRLDIFSNIGDVNNDGFEDLALSPTFSNESEKIFIFLGGTNISSSPDITINLNEDFPNPVNGQTGWGAGVVQGLGDLNGDGIDDFVLGDGQRLYTPELAQKNSFITGVIYVIYGQDTETPLFDGPDVELQADTSNTDNQQWIFGGLNSVASGDFDGDGTKDIVGISFRHANNAFDNGVGALSYFFGKDGFTSQPDTTIPIRTEYVYNPDQGVEEVFSRFTGRALLQSIPDQNEDGADELLYVGNGGQRNAVLYEIGDSPTDIATAIYAAPNTNIGLNPSGNFINKQYLPLVGDYNGDGNINFLGYQRIDRNYRDTPIYMYEIDNVAVSIADEGDSNPADFELKQNYPNPFNPSTNISFTIPQSGNVEIIVYNMLGQKVSTLINTRYVQGTHSITFDASNLASGIYLYRIKSNNFVSTKRMTLIK